MRSERRQRKKQTNKKTGFQPAAGVSIRSILEAANKSSNKEGARHRGRAQRPPHHGSLLCSGADGLAGICLQPETQLGDIPDSEREEGGCACGSAGLWVFLASWTSWSALHSTETSPGQFTVCCRAVCCLEVGRVCKEAAGRCQQQVEAEPEARRWRGLDTGVQLCPARIFADPLGLSGPMSIRAQSQSALAVSAVLMASKRKWSQCRRVKYWHTY